MSRPLEGMRVLTLEQFGAAPYGTMLLSELGAEVVKIEHPEGGDVSRANGPYFLGADDSHYFQTFARGKKSVAIDIKNSGGRAAFERLVRAADAVANNLRGDQPEKLGLTYAKLKHINPEIVCAHISAYGRDNARAAWPGFDYLMQAECGFTALTGEPDGPPVRFGLSMVDFMTGALMATGLLAAVIRARQTGEGADVDTCLYDTALHQLTYPAVFYLNEGVKTERLPRGAHPTNAPSQMFKTADGWVMVMAQTQKFWEELCTLIERRDLVSDTRYPDPIVRRERLRELTADLDAVFASKPTAHWVALLSGKVPCAPIYDLSQALDNPFPLDTGMIDRIAHPDAPDGLRMLACPIKIDGRRMPGRRGPKLGEHNDELLKGQQV
jgi:crotonobetainyl-CoA:carnitine CoA-transferase CaiB-like acyl-CoA transferase